MKYILLNHRYDALQWYELKHTHSETWQVFILSYTTLSKGNLMGDVCKIQFLSVEITPERIYMSKVIAKILNETIMFVSKCSSFK